MTEATKTKTKMVIDVAPEYLLIITNILKKYLPNTKVCAFGSRVTGKAKPYSDLDLVVMSSYPLVKKVMYELEDEFAESDLPFRIDILDWQRLSIDFQKIIKKQSVLLL